MVKKPVVKEEVVGFALYRTLTSCIKENSNVLLTTLVKKYTENKNPSKTIKNMEMNKPNVSLTIGISSKHNKLTLVSQFSFELPFPLLNCIKFLFYFRKKSI